MYPTFFLSSYIPFYLLPALDAPKGRDASRAYWGAIIIKEKETPRAVTD
jgi:hypothetical protein